MMGFKLKNHVVSLQRIQSTSRIEPRKAETWLDEIVKILIGSITANGLFFEDTNEDIISTVSV